MARRALRASRAGAICLNLLLAVQPAPAGGGGEDASWAKRFPDIATRIPHLDQRLASPDPHTRKRVIVELIYFHPRDSRRYPPFFRALLRDPAPEIRWEALYRLWEHHHFLSRSELPKTFRVPLLGPFQWEDPQDVKRFRASARSADAKGAGPSTPWRSSAIETRYPLPKGSSSRRMSSPAFTQPSRWSN